MTILFNEGDPNCQHLWLFLASTYTLREARTLDEELRAHENTWTKKKMLRFEGATFYCQRCVKIHTVFQEQTWDPEKEL